MDSWPLPCAALAYEERVPRQLPFSMSSCFTPSSV